MKPLQGKIVSDALEKSWFKRLETYLPLLTAAHVFSKAIQLQSGPNISCVIHYYMKLAHACAISEMDGTAAINFKKSVSTALNMRLGHLLQRPSNALKAALLDYRYFTETKRIIDDDLYQECWEAIISDGLNLIPEEKRDFSYKFARLAVEELERNLEESGSHPEEEWIPVLKWWGEYEADGTQCTQKYRSRDPLHSGWKLVIRIVIFQHRARCHGAAKSPWG